MNGLSTGWVMLEEPDAGKNEIKKEKGGRKLDS